MCFVKCLFKVFNIFIGPFFFFYYGSVKVFLHIVDINQWLYILKYFLSICNLHFYFLNSVFQIAIFVHLTNSDSHLTFNSHVFVSCLKNHLPLWVYEDLFPCFLVEFKILIFKFKSIIHSEIIILYNVKQGRMVNFTCQLVWAMEYPD